MVGIETEALTEIGGETTGGAKRGDQSVGEGVSYVRGVRDAKTTPD